MPATRNIPSLIDLCLQNIAEHVISHCLAFKTSENNEFLHHAYCIFQHYFACDLIDKLFSIHQSCRNTVDPERKCFCRYLLFASRDLQAPEWMKQNAGMCLEFIFPEKIKFSINCESYIKSQISADVTSYVFTKCKAIKCLDVHRSCLHEARFLMSAWRWNDIVSLNLSQTQCTDLMVIVIWKKLPHLKELYLSFCSNITDTSMLHLCCSLALDSTHLLCRFNGFCGSTRKLEVLDVDGTRISKFGILSTLLHLHSLKDLTESDRSYTQSNVPYAVLAIFLACVNENWELNRLSLKHIDCTVVRNQSQLEQILWICPHLEKIAVFASQNNLRILTTNFIASIRCVFLKFPDSGVLNSINFQDFLTQWGTNLEKLVITINSGNLHMVHLMEILTKCKNLKEFRIVGYLTLVRDEFVLEQLPLMGNLQILNLDGLRSIDVLHQEVFMRILKEMINLRILEVSSFIAESIILSDTLGTNNFKNLEKIVIHFADMRNVSFERFLSAQNSLKEIILSSCSHKTSFIERTKELSRQKNLSLDVKIQNAAFSGLARPNELADRNKCCRPLMSVRML